MDDEALVRVFKALGHENRYRLFVEIWREGSGSFAEGHVCFLNDVMERLNVGAPTVSHHLKELVAAGLISTEKQGKFLTCRVNPKALEALRVFFARA
ncbi:MAG: helix-turn-helix transcriptional regulator [Sandaracinaceae bacterium]|nr:helix-turn-helix transcriptional regulator [Sandaracinaceae bacterium]